ncbi:MAG: arylformamidase [Caldilineae bacterium]|nr:MAG: arylformamidase [Caldilineae bacterium]
MSTLIDITRPVTPDLQVWPGDTPYSATYVMRLAAGDSCNVSAITMSAHTGSHADAPYHFVEDGPRMAEMPLDAYMGPATVIDLTQALPEGGPILPEHLAGVDLDRIERLLVKSRTSFVPHHEWDRKTVYLAVETAHLLGAHGVRLFGTDAPSVDHQDSLTLDAHKALHRRGVVILENLYLRDVAPGDYELIALPLKLDNDGSPVRAVLRKEP